MKKDIFYVLKYCDETGRNALISKGWTINGDIQDCAEAEAQAEAEAEAQAEAEAEAETSPESENDFEEDPNYAAIYGSWFLILLIAILVIVIILRL